MFKSDKTVTYAKTETQLIEQVYDEDAFATTPEIHINKTNENIHDTEAILEESLSLENNEKDLIKKALIKHEGKRKSTAQELGISERTLYRKLKEFGLD